MDLHSQYLELQEEEGSLSGWTRLFHPTLGEQGEQEADSMAPRATSEDGSLRRGSCLATPGVSTGFGVAQVRLLINRGFSKLQCDLPKPLCSASA